ncbi:hypothetical protein [Candidatus Villigracilis affinis]|jgi:hypothetical protein|uniref:hypothetical protein n=1 Tax=Candidatus Villigracilis affinis TaxID=3140682 RepID=UPI001D407A38|nr:hypothetical protein [Anaerolineales bacterium]MBL0348479.1 hypothetical protein [Anaerolineales bacterium]
MFTHNKIGWGKWIVVTLILGVAAFIASPSGPLGGFWGLHAEDPGPVGMQKAFFILLTMIQSLAFGFGFAFLLFGREAVRSFLPVEGGLGLAVHFAISWSLLSWWPHSNLHQTHNPDNISGLLAIEYGFHVTLILGGFIIASFILMKSKQSQS